MPILKGKQTAALLCIDRRDAKRNESGMSVYFKRMSFRRLRKVAEQAEEMGDVDWRKGYTVDFA